MPDISHFSLLLRLWYRSNKRDLPWRETTDPYLIWLSEIILQQTRVEQGLPYYFRFVAQFPTLANLAAAAEDDVLKLWQGLGYYSRGRNLLRTANQIMNEFGGAFPDNAHDLMKLTGIGPYTARAIASFAFHEDVAVVDGNVYRVLSRIFGLDTGIGTIKGKKEFQKLADSLLVKGHSAEHNQAIMEFGALQCTPKPDCLHCPFNSSCVALAQNRIHELPVKSEKKPRRARYFDYLFIFNSEQSLIRKRVESDIWKNLYDFPLIENSVKSADLPSLLEDARTSYHINLDKSEVHNPVHFKHLLSHQVIHITIWPIQHSASLHELRKSGIFAVNLEALEKQYPVPVILHRFLEQIKPQLVSK